MSPGLSSRLHKVAPPETLSVNTKLPFQLRHRPGSALIPDRQSSSIPCRDLRPEPFGCRLRVFVEQLNKTSRRKCRQQPATGQWRQRLPTESCKISSSRSNCQMSEPAFGEPPADPGPARGPLA